MVKDHDFGKMSLFRQLHFCAISGGFRRERAGCGGAYDAKADSGTANRFAPNGRISEPE